MPDIGPRFHELRVVDEGATWRIVYRIDPDAIVIAEVFAKKTAQTPKAVLEACRKRLKEYDDA
jgi:phage-related protein